MNESSQVPPIDRPRDRSRSVGRSVGGWESVESLMSLMSRGPTNWHLVFTRLTRVIRFFGSRITCSAPTVVASCSPLIENHLDSYANVTVDMWLLEDLRVFVVGASPGPLSPLPRASTQCKQLKCVRPFSCRLGAVIGFPITLAVMQSQQPQKKSRAKLSDGARQGIPVTSKDQGQRGKKRRKVAPIISRALLDWDLNVIVSRR